MCKATGVKKKKNRKKIKKKKKPSTPQEAVSQMVSKQYMLVNRYATHTALWEKNTGNWQLSACDTCQREHIS